MRKKKKHCDPGPAKALIDMEVKSALDEVSIRDFPVRLQQRLQGGSQEEAKVCSWRKNPALAVGFFLTAVVVGSILVLNLILPSSLEKRIKTIETFLRNSPGYLSLLSIKEHDFIQQKDSKTEDELEWTIKHLLFSLYKEKFHKKDLSKEITNILRGLPAFKASNQIKKKGA